MTGTERNDPHPRLQMFPQVEERNDPHPHMYDVGDSLLGPNHRMMI